MRATDPIVTFLLVLVIGIVAGILFDRLAGPSWFARQFSGSTRGIITSALESSTEHFLERVSQLFTLPVSHCRTIC